tara:strand:- start:2020 stop:2757 length:738 start_codon:yes stop_codon:yes gene_type:complete
MRYPKKLLDTGASNTKIRKTEKQGGAVRMASLSLMPDSILCPHSSAAGCFDVCLKSSGRGRFDNVSRARQEKADFYHEAPELFLDQLRKELTLFVKVCARDNLKPVARLNVLSDIAYERHEIPQEFPNIFFYDYTKTAHRLAPGRTPENYELMFSYSAKKEYAHSVKKALLTDVPIAVVFKTMPTDPNFRFLGRTFVNGDASDLLNLTAKNKIVALKYKRSMADDDVVDNSDFIIDPTKILARAA